MTIKEKIIAAIRSHKVSSSFKAGRLRIYEEAGVVVELGLYTVQRWDVDVYEDGVLQPTSDEDRRAIVDDLLQERMIKDMYPSYFPPGEEVVL